MAPSATRRPSRSRSSWARRRATLRARASPLRARCSQTRSTSCISSWSSRPRCTIVWRRSVVSMRAAWRPCCATTRRSATRSPIPTPSPSTWRTFASGCLVLLAARGRARAGRCRRATFGSGDGVFVMAAKQARAVYLDRQGGLAYDATHPCEGPSAYTGLTQNAYIYPSMRCSYYLLGMSFRPYADEAYADASLAARFGYIIAHELAHSNLNTPYLSVRGRRCSSAIRTPAPRTRGSPTCWARSACCARG